MCVNSPFFTAGTVRAPCGHRAGTERAPIGRSKGEGRGEWKSDTPLESGKPYTGQLTGSEPNSRGGWMREASINSNMYIWSPQTTRTAARVALTPLIDAFPLI